MKTSIIAINRVAPLQFEVVLQHGKRRENHIVRYVDGPLPGIQAETGLCAFLNTQPRAAKELIRIIGDAFTGHEISLPQTLTVFSATEQLQAA